MSYFSADSGRPLEPIAWRRASPVTTLRTQGPLLGNPLNNRHGQASGAWGQHPPGSILGRVLGNVLPGKRSSLHPIPLCLDLRTNYAREGVKSADLGARL